MKMKKKDYFSSSIKVMNGDVAPANTTVFSPYSFENERELFFSFGCEPTVKYIPRANNRESTIAKMSNRQKSGVGQGLPVKEIKTWPHTLTNMPIMIRRIIVAAGLSAILST